MKYVREFGWRKNDIIEGTIPKFTAQAEQNYENNNNNNNNSNNSVALVYNRAITTKRPPLVGEVCANSCG
jgi:hypothetical protein